MIEKLEITVPFNGDELYEIIKLYDILRDMDFELSETQVQVFREITRRRSQRRIFLMKVKNLSKHYHTMMAMTTSHSILKE